MRIVSKMEDISVRSPLRILSENSITPKKSSPLPLRGKKGVTPKSDGKSLLRGFYNSPDKSPTRSSLKSARSGQYKVKFPRGAMGLELEPVIISSERQIGCRVRGFYFNSSHDGLSPELIRAKVTPGDVIVSVNGSSIISLGFEAALKRLVSLKDSEKEIVFKDMSNGTPSKHRSNGDYLAQSPKRQSGVVSKSTNNNKTNTSSSSSGSSTTMTESTIEEAMSSVSRLVQNATQVIDDASLTTTVRRRNQRGREQSSRIPKRSSPPKPQAQTHAEVSVHTPTKSANISVELSTPGSVTSMDSPSLALDWSGDAVGAVPGTMCMTGSPLQVGGGDSQDASMTSPHNALCRLEIDSLSNTGTSMSVLERKLHAKEKQMTPFLNAISAIGSMATSGLDITSRLASKLVGRAVPRALSSDADVVDKANGKDVSDDHSASIQHVESISDLVESVPYHTIQEMAAVSREKMSILKELSSTVVRLGESEKLTATLNERVNRLEREREEALTALQLQKDSTRRLAASAASAVTEADHIVLRLGAAEERNRELEARAVALAAELDSQLAAAVTAASSSPVHPSTSPLPVSTLDGEAQTDMSGTKVITFDVACEASDDFDIAEATAELKHEHHLQVAALKGKLEDAEKDWTGSQLAVEALRREVVVFTERQAAAQSELAESAVGNEVLRLTLADAEGTLTSTKRELTMAQSDMSRVLRERDTMSEKLACKLQECASIEAALTSARNECIAAEKAAAEASEAKQLMVMQAEEQLSKVSAALAVAEADRDAAVHSLEVERSSRKKLEDVLESRLSEVHGSRDAITSQMSALEMTLEEVSRKLERVTRERDDALEKESRARREMGALKSNKAQMEADQSRMQSTLVEMEAQSIEMRRTMDASSADRVDMEQRVGTMKGKLQLLSRVCDDVDSLEGQLSSCREELKAAMTAKDDAEQRVAMLERSSRQAEEAFYKRVADVESAWKDRLTATVTRADATAAELHAQLVASEEDKVRAKTKAKQMVSVLDAQITSLQEEHALHVKAAKEDRTNLIGAFEKRVRELKRSADEVHAEARSTSVRATRQVTVLKNVLEKDSHAASELSTQLAAATAHLSALEDRERQVKNELAKSIAHGNGLQAQCERVEKMLKDTEIRARDASADATSRQMCLVHCEAERDAANTRIQQMTVSLSQLEDSLKQAQQQRAEVDALVRDKDAALGAAQRRLSRVESEMSRLESDASTQKLQYTRLQEVLSSKTRDFEALHLRLNGLLMGNLNASFLASPDSTPVKMSDNGSSSSRRRRSDISMSQQLTQSQDEQENGDIFNTLVVSPCSEEKGTNVKECETGVPSMQLLADDGVDVASGDDENEDEDEDEEHFWQVSADSEVIEATLTHDT